MCVATDPSAGGRGEIKRASSHEENAWSRHQCLFEENLRKTKKATKKGLRILKIRVRELFTHVEGISTPCTCHKEWQPLIECAKHDFKIMYFPILCLLFFGGSTRVLPLLLRILGCDEKFRPT